MGSENINLSEIGIFIKERIPSRSASWLFGIVIAGVPYDQLGSIRKNLSQVFENAGFDGEKESREFDNGYAQLYDGWGSASSGLKDIHDKIESVITLEN